MGTCIPGFPSVPSAPGMPLEPWKEDLTSKQSPVMGTTASQQLCPPAAPCRWHHLLTGAPGAPTSPRWPPRPWKRVSTEKRFLLAGSNTDGDSTGVTQRAAPVLFHLPPPPKMLQNSAVGNHSPQVTLAPRGPGIPFGPSGPRPPYNSPREKCCHFRQPFHLREHRRVDTGCRALGTRGWRPPCLASALSGSVTLSPGCWHSCWGSRAWWPHPYPSPQG